MKKQYSPNSQNSKFEQLQHHDYTYLNTDKESVIKTYGQFELNMKLSRLRRMRASLQQKDTNKYLLQKIKIDLQAIYSQTNVDQIAQILSKYANDKDLDKLEKEFFSGLEKDKNKCTYIEEFYECLRKKKISGEDIDKIKRLVQAGRKFKIQEFLQEKFGSESQKLCKEYLSQFWISESKPLQKSKFIKAAKGLNIYQYPTFHISPIDLQNAKTLIVLGQTGCGKSSFLNSLTNFLAGVEIQDPFRYFIVWENVESQMKSITSEVTIYYVKDVRNGNCYRIVDTPGFGDIQGISKDNQTIKKVEELFKTQLNEIHLVLFLMKSSNTRVTTFQKYIFQIVMDLFDKSIAENFVFVLTFADLSQSAVLQHLLDKNEGFGKYWDILKEPKTIQVNNSGFFRKVQPEDKITQHFWKIGCEFMSKLVRKAETINPKGLLQTKQLIQMKKQLSKSIEKISLLMQQHLIDQQNIQQKLLRILQSEQQIKKNKDFQFTVDQQQWYQQTVKENVTICNICIYINCHEKCKCISFQQLSCCTAFDDFGKCTVCPRKCHYCLHTTSHILRKVRNIRKVITKEDLKLKYKNAVNKYNFYFVVAKQTIEQYVKSLKQTKQTIEHMTELQRKLSQISLSKLKPITTKQYIEFLIENLKQHKQPRYLKRIKTLQRTLEQFQVQKKIVSGQTLKETLKSKKQMIKHIIDDPRTKSSSIIQKFRELFEDFD